MRRALVTPPAAVAVPQPHTCPESTRVHTARLTHNIWFPCQRLQLPRQSTTLSFSCQQGQPADGRRSRGWDIGVGGGWGSEARKRRVTHTLKGTAQAQTADRVPLLSSPKLMGSWARVRRQDEARDGREKEGCSMQHACRIRCSSGGAGSRLSCCCTVVEPIDWVAAACAGAR